MVVCIVFGNKTKWQYNQFGTEFVIMYGEKKNKRI